MPVGNVYYFNPTCELAVANGSFSYQPPLLLQQMEKDLATLPFVFCSETDFVLTENKPNEKFIENLSNAGFQVPHFSTQEELESMPDGSFNEIIPWGWSPATHYKLANLKEKCTDEFKNSPVFNWCEAHKMLYERATSLSLLNTLINSEPNKNLMPTELTGTKVCTINEIEYQLKIHKQLVVKAPLSSSGRGIQMIRKPELDRTRKQWISGIIKQQGYLVAEPYLKKKLDFSFQFKIKSKNEIDLLGISFFETNTSGQYQRTFLNIKPDILNPTTKINQEKEIQIIAELIKNKLVNSIYSINYRGYIGIDAMIFEYQNQLFIHPCIEINCRMNMGILAKLLENKINRESSGKFEIFHGDSQMLCSMINQNLASTQLISKSKIISGFLLLNEAKNNTRFSAYIKVVTPK